MKITNHRKMILGVALCAISAIISLAVLDGERSSYVTVLLITFVSIILLRTFEQNAREVRRSNKHLRSQNEMLHALNRSLDEHGKALSGLRKDHHSNELRIRRLVDWSRSSAAITSGTNLLLQGTSEKLEGAQLTLSSMTRMLDRLSSVQHDNEKRLRLLSESVKTVRADSSQIRSDGHSNEMRLRRLVESIRSLDEEVQKAGSNQHSNELRLRRLVEMTRRLDEKIVEFNELINSQNEVQYETDALVKYRILEDLHAIKKQINDGSENKFLSL